MVERSSSPSHGTAGVTTKLLKVAKPKFRNFGLAFSEVLLNAELLYSLNLDAFKGRIA